MGAACVILPSMPKIRRIRLRPGDRATRITPEVEAEIVRRTPEESLRGGRTGARA